MAFGTGTHPTTQLCLELMETAFGGGESSDARRTDTEYRVIDVGCGSGILSIAALKLGATAALGVDIDPESIRNSRENAVTNGISDELVLGVGSVGEILDGKFPWSSGRLVLANILAPVIIRLFDAGLSKLVEPDGVIILSGILQEQGQGVIDAGEASGLKLRERRQMGDWVALAMESQAVK
jgi:ribosomal protein L11 methyltransferase